MKVIGTGINLSKIFPTIDHMVVCIIIFTELILKGYDVSSYNFEFVNFTHNKCQEKTKRKSYYFNKFHKKSHVDIHMIPCIKIFIFLASTNYSYGP